MRWGTAAHKRTPQYSSDAGAQYFRTWVGQELDEVYGLVKGSRASLWAECSGLCPDAGSQKQNKTGEPGRASVGQGLWVSQHCTHL
jgi:hypothetical protein